MNISYKPQPARELPADFTVGAKREVRILAVGEVDSGAVATGPSARITVASFSDINAASLAHWQPEIVISPLFGSGFDCLDLAKILSDARFAGRYRVVAADLPNPSLVRREVRFSFPDLDFDLLES